MQLSRGDARRADLAVSASAGGVATHYVRVRGYPVRWRMHGDAAKARVARCTWGRGANEVYVVRAATATGAAAFDLGGRAQARAIASASGQSIRVRCCVDASGQTGADGGKLGLSPDAAAVILLVAINCVICAAAKLVEF
jgi:hypothetical protein